MAIYDLTYKRDHVTDQIVLMKFSLNKKDIEHISKPNAEIFVDGSYYQLNKPFSHCEFILSDQMVYLELKRVKL